MKKSVFKLLVICLITVLITSVTLVAAHADGADKKDALWNTNPFTDVPEGKWYTDGVLFCYHRGYMTGTSKDTFSPNDITSRAQFVTVLAKVAGADLSKYTDDLSGLPFVDVKPSWYIKPLKWAYEYKYTTGTGPNTFTPNAPVTREQVATFLYTFAAKTGLSVIALTDLNYFHVDGDTVSGFAKKAVTWAVDIGLLTGTGSETLNPKGQCSRAQIALMIKKFTEYYSSNCNHVWSEPDCVSGRTCKICGYTRGTPLGHTSYATCTKDSINCSRCGRVEKAYGHTSSATCTKGAACTRCGKWVAPLGHNVLTPATCTEPSSKCTRCGQREKALGHSIKTPATCTSASSKCTRCGKAEGALGHNINRPATCTSASSKCSRCGYSEKALGHIVSAAPTCTEPSSQCTRCGQREKALGHSVKTPATCTSASSKCTRCGTVEGALGHNINRPATCTVESSECTRCGKTNKALGHSIKTASTCTSASSKCTRCGYIKPALGHTTQNGKCSRCSKEIFSDNFKKLCYYVKKNGKSVKGDNGENCYCISLEKDLYISHSVNNGNPVTVYTYILLYADGAKKDEVDIGSYWTYTDGTSLLAEMLLPYISSSYRYNLWYINHPSYGDITIADGWLDPAAFRSSYSLKFGSCKLNSTYVSEYQGYTVYLLDGGLKILRDYLKSNSSRFGGLTLKDLGFKNY